jgi:hypothetical protein
MAAAARRPSKAEQARTIERRAACFHEAGHAVVSAALGIEVDHIKVSGRTGFTGHGAAELARGLAPTDSHRLGGHVAVSLAGYLAERRFLLMADLPAGVRASRVFSLSGAAGDLASVERRNPFSRVSELTAWHEQARWTWRSEVEWSRFVLAWTRLSGRLLRQHWAHVEGVAAAMQATRGALRGEALRQRLGGVSRWHGVGPWEPEWFAAFARSAAR